MLRRMIKNGFIRKDGKDAKHQKKTDDDDQDTEFRYRYTNSDLLHICKTTSITDYTAKLQAKYLAHVARRSNLNTSKQLLFNDNKNQKIGRPYETLEQKVLKEQKITADQFYKLALNGTI